MFLTVSGGASDSPNFANKPFIDLRSIPGRDEPCYGPACGGEFPGGEMTSLIELRVQNPGEDVLVYVFREIREASEMIEFLSYFWPSAEFLVQPARH